MMHAHARAVEAWTVNVMAHWPNTLICLLPFSPTSLMLVPHCCCRSYLSEVVFAKSPLIVTDYPKDIKAFYMRINDDNQTVAAMDLLVPK
jgi:hypothetical protein